MTMTPTRSDTRFVLNHVSWQTYESLLCDHLGRSAPRFTYDQGMLEIMSPLAEHEEYNRTLNLLVEVVAEEWELNIRNLGSTTFRRQDLERGFEPDSCFYIGSAPRIRGKQEIDLNVDPPPDLVIEIDVTHSSMDKLSLHAALRVPEVWRYNGRTLTLHVLVGDQFQEREGSAVLPPLAAALLIGLLSDDEVADRPVWLRRVRRRLRSLRRRRP